MRDSRAVLLTWRSRDASDIESRPLPGVAKAHGTIHGSTRDAKRRTTAREAQVAPGTRDIALRRVPERHELGYKLCSVGCVLWRAWSARIYRPSTTAERSTHTRAVGQCERVMHSECVPGEGVAVRM